MTLALEMGGIDGCDRVKRCHDPMGKRCGCGDRCRPGETLGAQMATATIIKRGKVHVTGPRVGECVEVASETQQLVAQVGLVGSGRYPGW